MKGSKQVIYIIEVRFFYLASEYGVYSSMGRVLECTHKNLQWILVQIQLHTPSIKGIYY
jgi:hypothetical protein